MRRWGIYFSHGHAQHKRGQIAVTAEDFAKTSSITSYPDNIFADGKNKIGRDVIMFVKLIDDVGSRRVRFVIAVQVLRMPYAGPRGREALKRAYSHVCEAKISTTAYELADRLIDRMGFEALDVALMLVQQPVLPFFESNQSLAQAERVQVATDLIALAHPLQFRATAGVTVALT